ncbi:MAG: hypothetical protein U0798_12980 [Gemmataceae bacterium]
MPDPLTDPLARELAKLVPVPTTVTPASVVFAAGVQSAERKARIWQRITMGMVVLFVGSWVGMTLRPDQRDRGMASSNPTHMAGPAGPSPSTSTGASPKSDLNTTSSNTNSNQEPVAPESRPIPDVVARDASDEETLEARAKGIRLRNDILAGGLGLIPDQPKTSRPHLPYSSFEWNPTVLGDHYFFQKKVDSKPLDR